MFEFSAEHSLTLSKNKRYNDIAYDGEQIYICGDDQQIIVLDRACNLVRQLTSEHSYFTFCYDESVGCFWAASADSPGVLFQLTDTMTVMNQISLENLTVEYLFYDSSAKCLMASEKGRLYTISPSGECQIAVEINGLEKHSQKCCMIYGNLLCLSMQKRGPHLSLFSSDTGNILMDTAIFTGYYIKSMIAIPNASDQSGCTVLLLGLRQNDFPHIIEIIGNLDSQQQPCSMPGRNGKRINLSDTQVQQPNRRRMAYPFFSDATAQPESISQNLFNSELNMPRQNSSGPIPSTMERCQNCDWNCCCQNCFYQSCANIMESIALTETSIAHILNAEGEKLQKAIATASNVSELLQVNESVVKTIIHSTHLEQALFNKLEAIIQGEICDCSCDWDCDCHPGQMPCCVQALKVESSTDEDKTE